ncbi:MAG: HDOD domain-containing protein [Planctomycetota bacterium]
MSSVIVARQPILDRKRRTFAYELLYRSVDGLEGTDGDQATSTVMSNALLEIGLDRLVGAHRAFVNMTTNLILSGQFRALPTDKVVLEVLETVEPTPEILKALQDARDDGYLIALDDFVYNDRMKPMVELSDFIKVDLRAIAPADAARYPELLRRPGLQILAEKVETHGEFQSCLSDGYHLFQGFHFCEPRIIRSRKLPAQQLLLLRMLAALQEDDCDIRDIARDIERDVSLSFMLLRMANSALYSPSREIESVHQAVVSLGCDTVRRCVGILLMSSNKSKPRELMITAIVRARFCELMARSFGSTQERMFFTVGLLSVVDALTDQPMQRVLECISLTKEVSAAILHGEGDAGRAILAVKACERMDDHTIFKLGLDRETTWETYFEAIQWASTEETGLMQPMARQA